MAAHKRSRAAQHLLDLLSGVIPAGGQHGEDDSAAPTSSFTDAETHSQARAAADPLRAFLHSRASLPTVSAQPPATLPLVPAGPSPFPLQLPVDAGGSQQGPRPLPGLAPDPAADNGQQAQASLELLRQLEALPKRSLGSEWKSMLGGGGQRS